MGWFKTSKSASSSPSTPSSSNSTPSSASAHNHSSRWTRGGGGRREDPIQTRFSLQRNLRQVFDSDFRVYFQGDRGGRKKKKDQGVSSSSPVWATPSGFDDVLVNSRSDSATMMVPTHPLPLPVPEAVVVSSRWPSSSKRWVGNGGGGSGEEVNGNGNGNGSRFYHATVPKIPERFQLPAAASDAGHRRTMFHYSNTGDDDIMLNIPFRSAPTSGLCSPVLSPRRQSSGDFISSGYFTPQAPQARSSHEFSDFITGFHSHMSVENLFTSPDRSPLQSPTAKSPGLRSRNPSAPSSPLHQMIFPDNSSGRHDTNGNVNVHPLPLPPGSPNNYPASFSHQSVTKGDMSTMGHQWQKGKLIGSGSFGSVYHATHRHTGAMCAMKEVNLIPDDPKSAECIKQLQQEIRFLSQLEHPNIVQYYGSEIIKDQFYIYLELVYPGSINKYAREYIGAITEPVVRSFTRHILTGLAYLHSKGAIHRDIKGPNLLVNSDGIVKLADFGMAKHLTESNCAYSMSGTPYWMAPEVLKASMDKETGYNSAVDIWSLGCTIIEMFTGEQPWTGFSPAAAMFKVLHGSPNIPDTLSPEGKDFLKRCFCMNPAERPSASDLLEHPFVKNSHKYDLHNNSSSAQASSKITNHSQDDSHSSRNPIAKGKFVVNGCESDAFGLRNSPRSTLEKHPNFSPPRAHHGFSPNSSNGLSSSSAVKRHQHSKWQVWNHIDRVRTRSNGSSISQQVSSINE